MVCTFFGNRDTPDSVRPIIKCALESLISDGVTLFYVGNEGNFDRMVLEELQILQKKQSHIKYFVVLAYPEHNYSPEITIYPEGMEVVPKRFAVDHRNRRMLKLSDTVVTYVTHHGGAKKHKEIAEKQGKRIIDLTHKKTHP